MRPKRLFGFDGTAGKDPSSSTGLMSLGAFGLSPATAPGTLTRAAIRKLQGGLSAGLWPRVEAAAPLRRRSAQNRGEAPSPSVAPRPRPLPARGERETQASQRRVFLILPLQRDRRLFQVE